MTNKTVIAELKFNTSIDGAKYTAGDYVEVCPNRFKKFFDSGLFVMVEEEKPEQEAEPKKKAK